MGGGEPQGPGEETLQQRVAAAEGLITFAESLALEGTAPPDLLERAFLYARRPAVVVALLGRGLTLPRPSMRALLNTVRPHMAPGGKGIGGLPPEEEQPLTRQLKTMKTGVAEVAAIATRMGEYSVALRTACCLRVVGDYAGTLRCLEGEAATRLEAPARLPAISNPNLNPVWYGARGSPYPLLSSIARRGRISACPRPYPQPSPHLTSPGHLIGGGYLPLPRRGDGELNGRQSRHPQINAVAVPMPVDSR
jgi:hypothetical protein